MLERFHINGINMLYIITELKILEEGETILTVEPNENVTLHCRAVGAKLVGITLLLLCSLC